VFERFAPKLAAANIEHRINVLRCSQAARTVGDVITSNAARIKASMVIMSMRDKSRLAEALLGSCCNHVMHKSPVPVIVVRGSATAVTAAAPVAVAAAAPVAPAAAAAVPEN
jgi:nucleotide-binding universal stress UspA family protein